MTTGVCACPAWLSLPERLAGLGCRYCGPETPRRTHPAPLLPLALVLVGLLLLVLTRQHVMCPAHDYRLSYCPGYTATDSQEPRR